MESNKQSNIFCPICHTDNIQEVAKCNNCKNNFCKKCSLEWKERKDQCPFKCSQDIWKIALVDDDDKTVMLIEEIEYRKQNFRRLPNRKNCIVMIRGDENINRQDESNE